jgi:arylsulfatase A-like enzyme
MVRGPGIAPGTVLAAATAQVDFAPTVLDMADLPIPASVDGLSLLPNLIDPALPAPPRPGVLIEATNVASTSDPLPWQYHGIVGERWKYVERATGKRELYDLTADPYELVNVAGKSAYADVQRRLAELLGTRKWCSGEGCR